MLVSVLDQSPIIEGFSAKDAIHETVNLAHVAEKLGFHRFWLAEHHNMKGLACPCPEILLSAIGCKTRKIRIGSGGVLLPYYQALKVGETFKMLEALFPERVDLGIGRAPGGDRLAAMALNPHAFANPDSFPSQVVQTVSWVRGEDSDTTLAQTVTAMPTSDTAPEVWLLGSSNYSSTLASQLGLRFAFAHFISTTEGQNASKFYRRNFKKNSYEEKPYNMVCVSVICANTSDEARYLAGPISHRRLQMAKGKENVIQSTKTAGLNCYSDEDRVIMESNLDRSIIGDPNFIKCRLLQIKDDFEADELMILTITGDYQSRIKSYELIAKVFN